MKTLIITNNRLVYDSFSPAGIDGTKNSFIEFREDASQLDILKRARDLIHLGGKLIIHPMMGRVRPNETPYKSVFMEIPDDPESVSGSFSTDFMSLQIIEDSIHETEKFINNTYMIKYTDEMLPDLRYIDYLLIRNGMEEYR